LTVELKIALAEKLPIASDPFDKMPFSLILKAVI
jgi:hypothetical protein